MDTDVNGAPVSEQAQEIQEVAETVQVAFTTLFGYIFSEEWKTLPLVDIQVLRETLNVFITAGNVLREKFDADVWKGHSDGTVAIDVQSIRKQREGDTPGKKAKVLTPAEILAKRMAK